MKKFISALSSFVIAATAMGGTLVNAATNDEVDAATKCLIDIRTSAEGAASPNLIKLPSNNEATTIPVEIYFPQSSGVQTISLKLAINDGEPGAGTIKNLAGETVEGHASSMGQYGFTISGDMAAWKKVKIALDSGFFANSKKAAGNANAGGVSVFVPESFNVSYIGKGAIDKQDNMDSYSAWVAAGSPDYASYTPVTKWTAEGNDWAYNDPLITFDLNVPAGLADGKYELHTLEKAYNNGPSSIYNDDGTEKPKDEWDWVYTKFKGTNDGTDSVEREYEVTPLVITVGEVSDDETTAAPEETTAAPEETTAAPEETTAAPAETTPSETDKPAQSETAAPETVKLTDNTIIYNLVPAGKEYSAVADNSLGNNLYKAELSEAGQPLTINWTVKNDNGTAGMQFAFDFSQVTYVSEGSSDDNGIYPLATYNDADPAAIIYTWGQADQEDAIEDEELVFEFQIQLPAAKATAETYTIGLVNTDTAPIGYKVIPKDQDNPYPYVFHGLDIVIPADGSAPEETTAAPEETTAAPEETTAAPEETTAAPEETTAAPAETTAAPAETGGPAQPGTGEPGAVGTRLLGDTNCDSAVKINDVVLLNRYLAGTKELTTQGLANADCNVDGSISSDDATEIKEFLALLKDPAKGETKVNTAG